jgi:Flp pilus assembly pilin Flp
VILEHVLIAIFVVAVTHFLGQWIRTTFGREHG